jgi:hypothetical protein
MPQTILSVVLEVVPESGGRLSNLIELLRLEEEAHRSGPNPDDEGYARLKAGVPSLHFMSLSAFQDGRYDPMFIIEANFDGPPGPFWAQMEATLGSHLRSMLRCCKRPMDEDGPLYDAVTTPDSRYPIAAYFERRALIPSVFHQGNRGLTRDRILQEGELFKKTRVVLAQANPNIPNPYRGIKAQEIHTKLRGALLPQFPWLDQPASKRISVWEGIVDHLRLFAFLLAVIFVLSIPGLLLLVFLRAYYPDYGLGSLLAVLIVPVLAGFYVYKSRSARRGEAAPTRSGGLTVRSLSTENKATSLANPVTLVVAVIVYGALLIGALSFIIAATMSIITIVAGAVIQVIQTFRGVSDGFASVSPIPALVQTFEQLWWPTVRAVFVGLYSAMVFSLPAIIVWLRWLERRDTHHDDPPVEVRELRKMTQREDWIPQNHMGSIVVVKPGVLRMALFRAGHLGLGLLLRVIATDGYLGSMRTVHFAHWAFINNGSRLMFFSNFDHSWDSYLDDFIEKAHGGLTLAWGSCIGFPPTRFLVLDGASHGRQFKAWARNSMAVSRFWFSAYKNYTVDQIERNARIADGLRKATLTPDEAQAWAWDL